MRISVFGLGYVGLVTAACLASDGHHVLGVDVNGDKVALVNKGRSPIIEDDIEALVLDGVKMGRLKAITDAGNAVENSDLAFVCVGTPSLRENGALDTSFVTAVTAEIGRALRHRQEPFTYILRSTVLPGTVRSIVLPTLEQSSGKSAAGTYQVLYNPEFLREGSSVKDYYGPGKIVIGAASTDDALRLQTLYDEIDAKLYVTSYETAEAIKYADNAFHALKITFANEIGQICQAYGIDSREVMAILAADTKLNISGKYLRPGFAFGGSCLPKDLRALLSAANSQNLSLPMLAGVLPSNAQQVNRALSRILRAEPRRIGLAGLAFKTGTDDLRESPFVELAERLIGKGKDLLIYDDRVQLSQLYGVNRRYVQKHLPHLAKLLVESLDAFDGCDTIVVGHPVADEICLQWLEEGKRVIDLSATSRRLEHPNYGGILW